MDPRSVFNPDRINELDALRREVADAQMRQIAHNRRVIILFEGPEGASKKFALKKLAGALDPCFYSVHCIGPERRQAAEGHWLARFWRSLPGAGHVAIFYRSWYRRVLDDRIAGKVDGKALARAYDEINEFEAQQRDHGTLIIKLYFEVSRTEQADRLARRNADEWRRLVEFQPSLDVGHPDYAATLEDLKDFSDMRWSPWQFIASDDSDQATLDALAAIAKAYRAAMPSELPERVEQRLSMRAG